MDEYGNRDNIITGETLIKTLKPLEILEELKTNIGNSQEQLDSKKEFIRKRSKSTIY